MYILYIAGNIIANRKLYFLIIYIMIPTIFFRKWILYFGGAHFKLEGAQIPCAPSSLILHNQYRTTA